jgi:hypothetical protein
MAASRYARQMSVAVKPDVRCVVCGELATVALPPPSPTIARGPDPEDADYQLTGVLPDVALCATHEEGVLDGTIALGWCDAESCRRFGDSTQLSPCGEPFVKLPVKRNGYRKS